MMPFVGRWQNMNPGAITLDKEVWRFPMYGI